MDSLLLPEMGGVVVTDDNTKVQKVETFVPVRLLNPYPLYGYGGQIGTAVLDWGHGGFDATLFFDHHTPERLDYEVDPAAWIVSFQPAGDRLDPVGGLDGYVKVERR